MKIQSAPTTRRHSACGTVATLLVIAAVATTGAYAFTRTDLFRSLTTTRLVYSQSALANETWATFKADYIESDSGRVLVDHTGNLTTSRLQALTLQRAVWTDDKQTFDAGWKWSAQNEQLPNGLFISQYGPRVDGSYGKVGEATDSAADTDMALALLMAYGRWSDQAYLKDAETIIGSLYENSVVTVNGSPVLAATSGQSNTVAIDPAALNPAAFREFARVDPSHDWTGLVNNTYALTGRMLDENGDRLPEAATLDAATGTLTVAEPDRVSGPEAFTAVFNLGLDYSWNRDDRALGLMRRLPYAGDFTRTGQILTDGSESAATYGKLMPYLDAVAPDTAAHVHIAKLLNLYNQDEQAWTLALSSADSTWAWMGIASHNGALRQLTEIKS